MAKYLQRVLLDVSINFGAICIKMQDKTCIS